MVLTPTDASELSAPFRAGKKTLLVPRKNRRYRVRVAAQLAQVCLFKTDGRSLRDFCKIVSGQVEIDNGTLLSFHMGSSTVAHHPPQGELSENDILVTLQVSSPAEVDRIYRELKAAKLDLDDEPESTDWGWRLFYYRAAPHLMFEVGAPMNA